MTLCIVNVCNNRKEYDLENWYEKALISEITFKEQVQELLTIRGDRVVYAVIVKEIRKRVKWFATLLAHDLIAKVVAPRRLTS
uniref:Uncharacterized protein n=1 Tax=Physcomitrium patens TaxID=3218 RepID=A0A2K1JYX5_PHYPA|nr:hypothetical protein PHYPA_013844 [Physcomitrium patens]